MPNYPLFGINCSHYWHEITSIWASFWPRIAALLGLILRPLRAEISALHCGSLFLGSIWGLIFLLLDLDHEICVALSLPLIVILGLFFHNKNLLDFNPSILMEVHTFDAVTRSVVLSECRGEEKHLPELVVSTFSRAA